MKNIHSFKGLLLLATTVILHNAGTAQINCNTLDINKVSGKWVWQKDGYGKQWQQCEPIRKEMQRIMPLALDGLHATNSIAFGDMPAVPNTPAAPKYYECYLMLKKYECLKGYNILQPEGETGCWVYFVMNSIFQEVHPSRTDCTLDTTRMKVVCMWEIFTQKKIPAETGFYMPLHLGGSIKKEAITFQPKTGYQ